MKKVILTVGGIILVVILGRVMWAYQQVKNDEARMANAPVVVVTSTPEPPVSPIANAPIVSVATSTGPKETLLAMASDFNNLGKLLIPESAKNPQDLAPNLALVFDSAEFKHFIEKYMTKYVIENITKKLGQSTSEFSKAGFVWSVAASLPDVGSLIKESVEGDTATLNYDKGVSGTKTIQGVILPTSWVAKCTRQMVLENSMWKISTETAICK